MDAKKLLYSKVETKLAEVRQEFAKGLIESEEDHPLRTGITRANWNPSANEKLLKQDMFGISLDDILDFSGKPLVSLGEAEAVATAKINFKLGDTALWTNSVEWIGDLEHRRKFFDIIVDNAIQRARKSTEGG